MNMLGWDRKAGSVSQPVESVNQPASFLWIYVYKEMSIEKGQMKWSAASLQSFQLQFEVIVLAVLLASSSEQQCPKNRTDGADRYGSSASSS